MTAVEWLVQELKSKCDALITNKGVIIDVPNELVEKAKQLEKYQIIKGWEFGFNDGWNTRENDYNPNYHKKGTGESYYNWEFHYEYGKIINK